MPGYFYCAFDPKKKCPGRSVGIHDGDWWELTALVGRLRDAAADGEPIAGGLKVPTSKQVDALPSFDPEQFLLLGEDADWKLFGSAEEESGPSRWCSPTVLARHEKAMRAVDGCIPLAERAPWQRYLDAVTKLVARKQGLYCSTD